MIPRIRRVWFIILHYRSPFWLSTNPLGNLFMLMMEKLYLISCSDHMPFHSILLRLLVYHFVFLSSIIMTSCISVWSILNTYAYNCHSLHLFPSHDISLNCHLHSWDFGTSILEFFLSNSSKHRFHKFICVIDYSIIQHVRCMVLVYVCLSLL